MQKQSSTNQTSSVGSTSVPELLTKEELRQRLNLPSTRMVDRLMQSRKIPYIKLGHRTIRFDATRVQAAIDKLEVHEIGRKQIA